MTLRNYQHIDTGTQPPTFKSFLAIFNRLPEEEYKNAVIAFFQAASDGDSKKLSDYLDRHLTPAFKRSEKGLWESKRPVATLSADQMKYLTETPEAMRLLHKVLLWENVPKKELEGRGAIAEKLVELGLAELSKGSLKPSRTIYKVPNYDNAPPATMRKATRYLIKHLEVYASVEGSPGQEITYALQLVPASIADHILTEMKAFKRWVQSVASRTTDENLVPFVFLSFGKKLEKKEF
jgi:hypothetical protein